MAVRTICVQALRARKRVSRHQPCRLFDRSLLLVRDTPPALTRPLPHRMAPTLPDPSAQHVKAMPSPHDIGVAVRGSPSSRMAVSRSLAAGTHYRRSFRDRRLHKDTPQVRCLAALRWRLVHLEGTEEGSLRAGTVPRRAALAL